MGVSLKEKLLCEKLGLCLEDILDGDVIEGEALTICVQLELTPAIYIYIHIYTYIYIHIYIHIYT